MIRTHELKDHTFDKIDRWGTSYTILDGQFIVLITQPLKPRQANIFGRHTLFNIPYTPE